MRRRRRLGRRCHHPRCETVTARIWSGDVVSLRCARRSDPRRHRPAVPKAESPAHVPAHVPARRPPPAASTEGRPGLHGRSDQQPRPVHQGRLTRPSPRRPEAEVLVDRHQFGTVALRPRLDGSSPARRTHRCLGQLARPAVPCRPHERTDGSPLLPRDPRVSQEPGRLRQAVRHARADGMMRPRTGRGRSGRGQHLRLHRGGPAGVDRHHARARATPAPDAEMVVTGCMAERYGDELAEALPEVDRVAGFGVPVTLGPKPRPADRRRHAPRSICSSCLGRRPPRRGRT